MVAAFARVLMKGLSLRIWWMMVAGAIMAAAISPVFAADDNEQVSLLRDAEIEETLRDFMTPLMKVAGLEAEKLQIYLIKSPEINAAASIGPSLFMNSGLITRSKDVGQVLGVLAHEVGHMAGGHIVRMVGVQKKLSLATLAGIVLGTAAGIAARSGELASALALGSSHVGEQAFLHYSRGQEAAADQAAARFLDRLHWSPQGLLDFLKLLEKQDLLDIRRQDPYRRTHPLTGERIAFFNHHCKQSPYIGQPWPTAMEQRYERMKIKLIAFIEAPGRILSQYPASDTTVIGRLARVIALHRNQKPNESLALLDALIKESPSDPYLIELKGQILMESGRITEASHFYQKALSQKPDSDLIRIAYAQALLEQPESVQLSDLALRELNRVSIREHDNSFLWRLRASAYGRLGRMGMMALMLAEEASSRRDQKAARTQAERALKLLGKQGEEAKARMRAQDILNDITVNKEENDASLFLSPATQKRQ